MHGHRARDPEVADFINDHCAREAQPTQAQGESASDQCLFQQVEKICEPGEVRAPATLRGGEREAGLADAGRDEEPLQYPVPERRIPYSTDTVGSLHAMLRKSLKVRGQFPNAGAATELRYLAL